VTRTITDLFGTVRGLQLSLLSILALNIVEEVYPNVSIYSSPLRESSVPLFLAYYNSIVLLTSLEEKHLCANLCVSAFKHKFNQYAAS
jgi:hypothetical protein